MQHYGGKEFSLEISGFDPDIESYQVGEPPEPIRIRGGGWDVDMEVLERHGVNVSSNLIEDAWVIEYLLGDTSIDHLN